ncbi:hypothetical protein C8R44DRAFT_866262 [Mycena epipterygia]|nr:hypothetical protein C8R44DRAFT_866262 [Mycena epipterygia]
MSDKTGPYTNISALAVFENARQISMKVTLLDVFIHIGPTNEDHLMGAIAKREEVFDYHLEKEKSPQYAFIGDLKQFYPVDVAGGLDQRGYMHLTGLVTASDKDVATFEMDLEQYTLAYSDTKRLAEEAAKEAETTVVARTPMLVFPVLGVFGDSPCYKSAKKPVPWINRIVLIGGFLTGISEKLSDNGAIKQRFIVEVDNVTFLASVPGPKTAPAPAVTPSATSANGSSM